MSGAAIHDLAAARGGAGDPEAWASLGRASDIQSFAAQWLVLQASFLGQARSGLVVAGPDDAGPFVPLSTWPANQPASAELSVAIESALSGRKGVLREPAGALVIAFPLVLDERLRGAVGFELAGRGRLEAATAARQLQWGMAGLEAAIRRGSLLPNRNLLGVMDTVAILLESPTLAIGLRAAAAEIAASTGARWVAIGLAQEGTVARLDAITTSFAPSRNAELVRNALAAMQESLDQRADIEFPQADGAEAVVNRAHERLAELAAPSRIASTLIVRDMVATGVILTCEAPERPLDQSARGHLRLVGALIGPAIELRRRDDRWIGGKLMDSLRVGLGTLVGPGRVWAKAAALAVLLSAAAVPFVEVNHKVSASAVLEGAVQRILTAPVQGYIASADARAGDRVSANQTLAKLDDRDLVAERARWAAERDKAAREHQKALAEGDRTRVQVQRAQIDLAQARLDLIDEQLDRTEIRAPFDGIVVRGDLSQSLGAPVQRGDPLFEIVPLGSWRLSIRVDERDITLVQPGQEGSLVLASHSGQPLRFRVDRVTPIAAVENGSNTFRVDASMTGSGPALRPGMTGTARIEVGTRSLADSLTVRIRQWLALTVWRWQP